MRRWDNILEHYMRQYHARGCCPGTIERVRRELERWGLWLKRCRPKPNLEKVDSEVLIRYFNERGRFRSKATLSASIGIIRGVGDYLVREGYWNQNPLRWMKGPKLDFRSHLPRRISSDNMKQLWQTAASNRQPFRRSLWLCILAVLYGTGLRRGELERLDVSDWNREEGILTIDGRKTGYQRCIVVPELSWRCLESYLVQRHNHLEKLNHLEEKALFVNSYGLRFKGIYISNGIRRLAQRAGVKKITLHQFRHTCASDLLEAGLHVAQVQKVLGHQDISTTVRYLQVSDPQRREAVKLHPINDILIGGKS